MKFAIPVKFTGVKTFHVDADTLDEALKMVGEKADTLERYELTQLGRMSHDILAPAMMLREEDLSSWPYWAYGWHGTDGCDWRQYMTNKGRGDIPDIAEEFWPIPPYNDND